MSRAADSARRSASRQGATGRWLAAGCLLLASAAASAQETWLVTYGPGSEVWERFGHNALWLRDPDHGLDHSFSFGYFEIDRPGFLLEFARGIMLYYGAASDPEREFAYYRSRDRSIRLQRLDLTGAQQRELLALLDSAIFPQPQFYDYDYFFANCSTWLRDLLDEVSGGGLRAQLEAQPARLNFRDHTRRLTRDRYWLHTGIMLMLGPLVDAPRTAWEEGFLPESLADWLVGIELDGAALVVEDRMLHVSQTHRPPTEAAGRAMMSLCLGLVLAGLIVALGARGRRWGWQLGLALAGLAGCVLLAAWCFTDHTPTRHNAMLLLLHPLWLIYLLPRLKSLQRWLWWPLLLAAVAGALLMAWPQGPQFRFDQLLLVAPLVLALLAVPRLFWRP